MGIVPILMYHDVARPPAATSWPVLYVDPAEFRRQLAVLRALRYRIVTLSEALPVLRGQRRDRVAVVTFDDAYADVFENALPALLDVGGRATTYAVSGFVGKHNAWDVAAVGVRKPLMDQAQLREWRRLGMEVGAHSRTHPSLPLIGERALVAEVEGSRHDLEDLLGCAVDHFCYPYGDVDERVVGAVSSAGFATATTTRRGRARTGDDLLRLRRVRVKRQLPLALFPLRLVTSYEDRRR